MLDLWYGDPAKPANRLLGALLSPLAWLTGRVAAARRHKRQTATQPPPRPLVVVGTLRGLYAGRWGFGSFEEVSALVETVGLATALMLIADLALGRTVPLSVPLIASTLVLSASAGIRYVWRAFHERRLRPASAASR